MYNTKRAFFIGVFALTVLARSTGASAQESDSKAWLGTEGQIGLLENLRLDLGLQERLSSAVGREKELADAELRLTASDYFKVGAAYRYIGNVGRDNWHRVSLNLSTGYKLGRIGLGYRLRLQSTARTMETVSNVRNKVGAEFDLSKRIRPMAAMELHYSPGRTEFREFRIISGAEIRVAKKVRIGAYYMFQSEFNKRINENNHIVRLGIIYKFRRVKKSKRRLGG